MATNLKPLSLPIKWRWIGCMFVVDWRVIRTRDVVCRNFFARDWLTIFRKWWSVQIFKGVLFFSFFNDSAGTEIKGRRKRRDCGACQAITVGNQKHHPITLQPRSVHQKKNGSAKRDGYDSQGLIAFDVVSCGSYVATFL